MKHWRDFYDAAGNEKRTTEDRQSVTGNEQQETGNEKQETENHPELLNIHYSSSTIHPLAQLHSTYIVMQNDPGFLLIHQQNAHERILYERFTKAVGGKAIATQQSLFPATILLAAADAVLLNELLPDLHILGYHLEPFGSNTFLIQGTPADMLSGNEKMTIEKMLEQYKHFSNDLKYSKREKLLRSLAWQQSIKAGTNLNSKEMSALLEELFACAIPNITPAGKPVYTTFKKMELDKMFGR